jgi:hypothetical protein
MRFACKYSTKVYNNYNIMDFQQRSGIPITFYSSVIFATNSIIAYLQGYIVYASLFACLTVSSLLHHYNPSIVTEIFDKLVICSIVLWGAYVLWKKYTPEKIAYSAVIVLTFLACVYLYTYGWFSEQYVFDPDQTLSRQYHVLMHLIGSIGHHCIVLL